MFSSSLRRLLNSVCVLLLLLACQSEQEKIAAFMENGEVYAQAGSLNEAVIEFRNALQLDPNLADAHYRLAKAYLELKRGNEAHWEFSETVRLDASNADARLKLSGLSLLLRNFDEALEQAEQALVLDPSETSGYLLKAQALERLERADEAEVFYLKAIDADPEEGSYLLVAAGYYARQNARAKAAPMLQKFTEIDPGFLSYSSLASFLAEDQERTAEATAAFEKAIETADASSRGAAVQSFANYLYRLGRSEDAAAFLEAELAQTESGSDGKLDLIYLLSRLYQSLGNITRAEELIEAATSAQPGAAEPYLILSAYRGRKGDLEGALEAAEAALALAPEEVRAKLRKAELLVDLGYREQDEQRIAAGQRIVETILQEQPSNPEGLFVKGKLKLALADTAGSIEALRAALDSRPNWAQAHLVLGSALVLSGDNIQARAEVARAVEFDPGILEARRMLAKLHAGLGEHEYAVEQGRVYLEAHPQDVRTRIVVAQSLVRMGLRKEAMTELEAVEDDSDAELLYAKARLHLALGDRAAAHALLIRATQSKPHHSEILGTLLVVEQNSNAIGESKILIEAAVAKQPENAELVRLQGILALAEGDLALAEQSLQRATELDPKNVMAYQQLAALYQKTDRLDETLETYERALEQRPNEARLYLFIAVLYELAGRVDEAIEKYERAIALAPDLGQAKNNLAYLLAEAGRELDRALDLAQEAKRLLPGSGNAADTLGWVLYKHGRASAAVGYLKEAVATIDPNSANLGVVRHHLAQAYEASGQKEEAIKTLERAVSDLERRLTLSPSDGSPLAAPAWSKSARQMLSRLKAAS